MLRSTVRLGGLLLLAIVSLSAAADTLSFTIAPTTTDEVGAPLPSTGPGALIEHKVELGTCAGVEFGTLLDHRVVQMPNTKGKFDNLQPGVYCLRAFARNQFGQGKPYPTSIVGLAPGNQGSIAVVRIDP